MPLSAELMAIDDIRCEGVKQDNGPSLFLIFQLLMIFYWQVMHDYEYWYIILHYFTYVFIFIMLR